MQDIIVPIVTIMMPVLILFLIFSFKLRMTEMQQKSDRDRSGSRQELEALNERLQKIERRLENLETIVLESERKKEYERL